VLPPVGLLANLAALIDDTSAKLRFGEMIAQQYLDGLGPFQERLPFSGLMWRFLWDYHLAMLRWARWAHAEVQAWPPDLSQLDATAGLRRGGRPGPHTLLPPAVGPGIVSSSGA